MERIRDDARRIKSFKLNSTPHIISHTQHQRSGFLSPTISHLLHPPHIFCLFLSSFPSSLLPPPVPSLVFLDALSLRLRATQRAPHIDA